MYKIFGLQSVPHGEGLGGWIDASLRLMSAMAKASFIFGFSVTARRVLSLPHLQSKPLGKAAQFALIRYNGVLYKNISRKKYTINGALYIMVFLHKNVSYHGPPFNDALYMVAYCKIGCPHPWVSAMAKASSSSGSMSRRGASCRSPIYHQRKLGKPPTSCFGTLVIT